MTNSMYKKIALPILAAIVLTGVFSVTATAATGMVELLNLTGPRQVAMGETPALFDPDPFNLDYNPALIVGLDKGRIGFSHNEFIQNRNTNVLATIFPAAGADFGAHMRLSKLGNIEVRDTPTSEPLYIAEAYDFSVKAFRRSK
jgi:hypothetical protein